MYLAGVWVLWSNQTKIQNIEKIVLEKNKEIYQEHIYLLFFHSTKLNFYKSAHIFIRNIYLKKKLY